MTLYCHCTYCGSLTVPSTWTWGTNIVCWDSLETPGALRLLRRSCGSSSSGDFHWNVTSSSLSINKSKAESVPVETKVVQWTVEDYWEMRDEAVALLKCKVTPGRLNLHAAAVSESLLWKCFPSRWRFAFRREATDPPCWWTPWSGARPSQRIQSFTTTPERGSLQQQKSSSALTETLMRASTARLPTVTEICYQWSSLKMLLHL